MKIRFSFHASPDYLERFSKDNGRKSHTLLGKCPCASDKMEHTGRDGSLEFTSFKGTLELLELSSGVKSSTDTFRFHYPDSILHVTITNSERRRLLKLLE